MRHSAGAQPIGQLQQFFRKRPELLGLSPSPSSPKHTRPSHSSYEHPNHNTLHVQPASLTPFRLAKDVSKLAKFLNVLSAPRQRQQFVAPNDVQVIFVLALQSRQNRSAFVR